MDIESTDTLFSDLENKYTLLGAKWKQIFNALKTAKISLSLGLLKKLKEDKLKMSWQV